MGSRSSSIVDRVAREAARLYESGKVDSVTQAIRAAAVELGHHGRQLPAPGRVREHIRAMSMQSMGDTAYADSIRRTQSKAEQLMTLLEESFDDARTYLVGRAVKGHVDGDTKLHVRMYTCATVHQVSECLGQFGYIEQSFDTPNTRLGRVNRIGLDDDGVEIVLTRCPPDFEGSVAEDLFTGRVIVVANLEQIRELLERE